MLFAIALGAALRIARRSFHAGVLDLWYADDGTLIGPAKPVADAIRILEKPLSEIGLCVNRTKCKLWIKVAHSGIHIQEIQCSVIDDSPDPLTILSFPIAGNTVALQSFARKEVDRSVGALKPLSNLNHAQGEAAILISSGPTARLRDLLRFNIEQSFLGELLLADSIFSST